MALENLKNFGETLDIRWAEKVSTLENVFLIGWFRDQELASICTAINSQGEFFASFMKDGTVSCAKNLSKAEKEAIDGIKVLYLGWSL